MPDQKEAEVPHRPSTAAHKSAARNRSPSSRPSVTDVPKSKLVEPTDEPTYPFGPTLIRTPEDALNAFMRGEITEDTYRDALAKFGANPAIQFGNVRPLLERPDAAFRVKIPDDIYDAAAPPVDDVEARQKVLAAKQELRDEATELAKKDKTTEETVKRENADFRAELEEKYIAPAVEEFNSNVREPKK